MTWAITREAAQTDVCAACGSSGLREHLEVAGQAGEQGLIPTTDAFGTALGDIVVCPRCGHMQLDHLPSEASLSEAYGEAASQDYVEEAAGQRATAAAVLDAIERVHPGRGRLLDLGCWVGFLLAEARERGWDTVGIEPSAWAANYAREQLALDVREDNLFAAPLEEGVWDAVVMGDVIEHLPRPGAALDRIHALLRADGVLALMLPDAGSALARRMGVRWWSVIPTHVQYFTRASVLGLLHRHAFQPLVVATQPKAFSVSYYLGRLGGYSPPLARAFVAFATAVGVADRMWAPDFGDRMLVVARRVG